MIIDDVGLQLLEQDLQSGNQQAASRALVALLNQMVFAIKWLYGSGTTAQRPNDPWLYQLYFDTTVGSYMYCDTVRNGPTPAHWTQIGSGGGGGTVTSITATLPIVVTPSPITATGVVSANDFVASGPSHARGTVPDPGAVAGTTHFLREDATWQVPGGGLVSPLTTKGDIWGFDVANNRIPVGTNNQVLISDSTAALGVRWVNGGPWSWGKFCEGLSRFPFG